MLGGGRQTALALLLAIVAARLLLDHRLQATWYYLWHSGTVLGSEWKLMQIVDPSAKQPGYAPNQQASNIGATSVGGGSNIQAL